MESNGDKETPFYNMHVELGAKMVSFAGYQMPIQYSGILAETRACREKLVVFDVSHMGEIWVTGSEAKNFAQWVTTNNVNKLASGKAQYSCISNDTGGIVDDLLVYHISPEEYFLVVNAANTQKDWDWFQKQLKTDQFLGKVNLENASDGFCQLAVQGPLAIEAMNTLTNADLSKVPYYGYVITTFAGVPGVMVSITGYTGAGGIEIYAPSHEALKIWAAIMKAGKPFGIIPAGLGARDLLRLEVCYPLCGTDIDKTTNPIEAGLGWITPFDEDNQFIGRNIAENLNKKGNLKRKLRAFKMVDRAMPRNGYKILNHEGTIIGKVTSGGKSPFVEDSIGMGYVDKGTREDGKNQWLFGSEIWINCRGKKKKAKIVKPPFIKKAE